MCAKNSLILLYNYINKLADEQIYYVLTRFNPHEMVQVQVKANYFDAVSLLQLHFIFSISNRHCQPAYEGYFHPQYGRHA